MSNINQKFDLIVLGAGVAGLACADEILRKNPKNKVLVLEKNNFVGGLSATMKTGKFSYDLAPHRWFTKNQELNRWIDELLGEELIWVNKYTPMYQFDKFFDYPIKIGDIIKKINPLMSFSMLTSYVWEKGKNKISPRRIVTMKDAYLSRFGSGLYKWFNEEYNEKLWGEGGCEAMSADFVNQRIKNLSLVTVLLNAVGIGKGNVISLVEKFRFPKMGVGKISEELARRMKLNKGEIRLSETVLQIKIVKDGYRIITSKGTYETNKVISSIPINIFLESFGKEKIVTIKKFIDQLKFVNQKIVVLFAKGKKLTNFTWVYVHPKKIKTFRFMETNNWSKDMSPKNKTSLVFEYPYQQGDELDKISNKDLVKITIDDFLKYFAPKNIKRTDIISGKVYLVPNAYPKYDFNYRNAINKIYKFVNCKLLGVQLIGRNGMFHYNNMDHSIYTGILAARNYLDNRSVYDLRNVNNEAEYLEEIKKVSNLSNDEY